MHHTYLLLNMYLIEKKINRIFSSTPLYYYLLHSKFQYLEAVSKLLSIL